MSPANMDTGRVQSVMKVLRAFDYIVEQSMLTTGDYHLHLARRKTLYPWSALPQCSVCRPGGRQRITYLLAPDDTGRSGGVG